MQKVTFITSVSTPDRSYAGGEAAELSAILAKQWKAAGYVTFDEPTQTSNAATQSVVIEVDASPEVAPSPAPEPIAKRKPRK